ncbi:cysteine--tRNA ligase [Candidatus Woesearchaeota archaeon]|nr:cysteine--tRNA ligase [Candidatus Woesearchaeota archaeon]
MVLQIYNTLTRKKEIFTPLKNNLVGLYTCGPTVYHYAHIGNLRTYIFEDILKRVLLYNKFKVKHVMNITNVGHLTSDSDTGEDKMEKGAKREGKSVWQIADFYTKAFMEDIKKLNIIKANIFCKATDYIKEQIELITKLEKKGFTYIIEDGVYFDTSKLKDYGKLAKLDIEGLKAGTRVEFVKGKKNITDFALWKFSPKDKKRQMEWDSPCGKGFPGWHIECSAMSMKFLGETFDIHCGGIDHIPVHHTNEIAQSETATGKKFVNYWMHGEFLNLEKEKMAKSGENFITLSTLEKRDFDPLAYRFFCLSAHYRSSLNFSFEALESAKNGFEKLKNKIWEIKKEKDKVKKEIKEKYREEFLKLINNNLDMPGALALLWDLIKEKEISGKSKLDLILDFDKIFGLNLKDIKEEKIPKEILNLVKQREKARQERNFAESDKLRKLIQEKGYTIEDTKGKPIVKKGV